MEIPVGKWASDPKGNKVSDWLGMVLVLRTRSKPITGKPEALAGVTWVTGLAATSRQPEGNSAADGDWGSWSQTSVDIPDPKALFFDMIWYYTVLFGPPQRGSRPRP